ncbi:MAG TPA: ABC transporter C-terminal domain-containing protein [Nitrospiraceae bacterium]
MKGAGRGKTVGPTRAMASQAPAKSSAGDRRDLNKTQARLEKQVARAETEIAECETNIKARDLELANPALYKDESAKWSALQIEYDGWKKDLVRLTARWETLSAELEDVKQKLTAFA